MKKTFLLTVAFAGVAALANAQQLQLFQPEKANMASKTINLTKMEASSSVKNIKTIKRSAQSGLYYTRPVGSIYNGSSETGSYLPTTMLVVPPFSKFQFVNQSTNKNQTSWTDANGESYANFVDEATGNLNWDVPSYDGYFMHFPVITKGKDSWKMGNKTVNGGSYYPEYSGVWADTITAHSFCEINSASYGFGALDTGYLLGTGNITFEDGSTWKSFGVAQFISKPMAPLYIEDFNVMAYTDGGDPFTGDAKLTLTIYNVTPDGGIGNQVLAEMTADANSVIKAFGPENIEYTNTGKVSGYYVNFASYEENSFGAPVKKSVVLDQDFYVVITGFDQDGVNVGLTGTVEDAEDALNEEAMPLITDGTNVSYFGYRNPICLSLCFTGGFNYIDIASYVLKDTNEPVKDLNVIKFDNDGKCLGNVGFTALGEEADFVPMLTAFPWYSGEGNENYFSEEMFENDWITVDAAEAYYDGYATPRRTGEVYLTFECEKLGAGETKRAASLYFEGAGYKSSTPVVILQGDATVADAIENPIYVKKESANAPVYNLNGQRVAKDAKGILIQNGKKFINK